MHKLCSIIKTFFHHRSKQISEQNTSLWLSKKKLFGLLEVSSSLYFWHSPQTPMVIVKFAFVVKRISWIYRFPKNPCISLQCWMLMQGCRSLEGQKVIANNGVIKFLQNYFFYYMIFLYCGGDLIRCNNIDSLVLVCLIHLLLAWVKIIIVYYENINK